ncbi:DUF2628 domain-containing protein [Devosia albogilva]|uniref:DUF2628 domain-containing protein n=1 Tax=Devosia albogilva TaxID=429726 RepID=A0ABW5QJE3_9HYPH
MTLYAIFDPKSGSAELPRVVPERFSWLAMLLPPVYLLGHRLWLEVLVWLVKTAALVLLARYLGGGTAFLLYVLAAIWIGLSAPDWRRQKLARQGWRFRGDRVAASPDMAQLEALR